MSGHDDRLRPIQEPEQTGVILLLIAIALAAMVIAELTLLYAPYLVDEEATESQLLQIQLI